MRKLSHQEIAARQITRSREVRIPLAVVLDNIRSLENVGSIFRTADGAGIQKLWLCGITGYPPQGGIAKTALGAEDNVAWEHAPSTADVVRRLKKEGHHILVLEQADGAVPVEEFRSQGPVCLVVGNEVDGVADDVFALADAAVEIGMSGVKNSLNVAVAFGIAVYALRKTLHR